MSRKAFNRIVWLERGWQPVFIGFCPNEKAWRKGLKQLGLSRRENPYPTSDGHLHTFHRNDGPPVCIVTVQDGAESTRGLSEIIGVLIHESAHVWQDIRQYIGETAPGAEMEAYALQTITQGMISAFHKTRGLPPVDTIGLPELLKQPTAP